MALERIGGLRTNDVRQRAWPILLGCASTSTTARKLHHGRNDDDEEEDSEECRALRCVKESIEINLHNDHLEGTPSLLARNAGVEEKHREEFEKTMKQIDLDVARSYSSEENSPEAERKRRELATFIKAFFVLERAGELYYYQGFHDVCAVTLEVFGYEHAPKALRVQREMSRRLVFRDAHRKEFDCVMSTMTMIHEVIRRVNPDLHLLLAKSGVSPYYAVSMLICNYAHDVPSHEVQARIFDATIAFGHPVFSVYLAAALPLRWLVQERVMASERDAASIHEILRGAAAREFTEEADTLVRDALRLSRLVRPLDLVTWAMHAKNGASLPHDSVLVTSTARRARSSAPLLDRVILLLDPDGDLVNVVKVRNRTKLHFLLVFLLLLYTLF